MNGLSLFTGSGIGDLTFREIIPGYRTICYVENEPFCVAHLIKSIKDGLIDDAPIWDDIRTFDTVPYRGMVDIVFGGFPCQPFSIAGKNKGAEDERNMWPDTFRVIGEIRPRFAFLENVPNLLAHEYGKRIIADLTGVGYDCEWGIVGASDVGANHHRKRLWVLAHTNNTKTPRQREHGWQMDGKAKSNGLDNSCKRWWTTEPGVGRVADGIPSRVHRLKMLGNAWVPQVVARILEVANP